MGLDLLNFIPHNTSASGMCESTSAFLNLAFEKTKITFHFVLVRISRQSVPGLCSIFDVGLLIWTITIAKKSQLWEGG